MGGMAPGRRMPCTVSIARASRGRRLLMWQLSLGWWFGTGRMPAPGEEPHAVVALRCVGYHRSVGTSCARRQGALEYHSRWIDAGGCCGVCGYFGCFRGRVPVLVLRT